MQNPTSNDRLIRLDEVLKEIGIKKTNFYETIKELKKGAEREQKEAKKQEILTLYVLVKQKKFGRTSIWSYNQIQQFISHIKTGYAQEILDYIKYKNVA